TGPFFFRHTDLPSPSCHLGLVYTGALMSASSNQPPSVWQEPPAPPPRAKPKARRVDLFRGRGAWVLTIAIAVFVAAVLVFVWFTRQDEKPAIVGALDHSIAVAPDGSKLAVGLRDGSVRLIDVATRQQVARADLGVAILAVDFGPEDSVLALVDAGATTGRDPK